MITANELRIGNLIHTNGRNGVVSSIHRSHITILNDVEYFLYNEIVGIPLTPSILEAAGFHSAMENADNLPCWKKGDFTIAKWIGDKWQMWYKLTDFRNSPQYVHQLQNAFYILTNQELQIKLK